jgi:hypothetical protein
MRFPMDADYLISITLLACLVPRRNGGQRDVGEYRSRATEALSAIRTFDSDLSDVLHVSRPAQLSSVPAEPYPLGYDIVGTFCRLGPENARIAGDELTDSYSWAKR